jgi:hypothetical protein
MVPPRNPWRAEMTIDRYLRLIAGLFVFASVLLGMFVNPNFYWFTAFVGLNLFQSAFTNWCPMVAILKAAGVRN